MPLKGTEMDWLSQLDSYLTNSHDFLTTKSIDL
jgi:hypothetical protein